MGASRQSYSLQMDFKHKNYKRFRQNLAILFYLKRSKYERKMIILDSFITPFNKKFGCKWFGHNWKYDHEDGYYICWKCYQYQKPDVYKSTSRQEKIDKILK